MLIDTNPVERYRAVMETQRINWDSLKFNIEAISENKMNVIHLLFTIISNLDLNSVYLKHFKEENGGCGLSHLQLHKKIRWEDI